MRFIHFGCWNHGLCNIDAPQTNDLSRVMKKLSEYVAQNTPDFMTIAGDNYYQDKIKDKDEKKPKEKEKKAKTGEDKGAAEDKAKAEGKDAAEGNGDAKGEKTGKAKKIYNETNFLSGLRCLPDSIPKFVILGNHEYDNIEQKDKCFMINEQKKHLKNTTYFNDVICIRPTLHTLIIMIDTTLYEINEDEFKTMCFKDAFSVIPPEFKESLPALIDYQNRTVYRHINNNSDVKNIIFIAHHPIVTSKFKPGKGNKNEILTKLYDFYVRLLNIPFVFGKNIYHLCADNHLYQNGLITFKQAHEKQIRQIVCGTGGAEKDYCPQPESKPFVNDQIKYEFECNSVNGFLDVNESPAGDLNFNFIEVPKVSEPSEAAAATDAPTDVPTDALTAAATTVQPSQVDTPSKSTLANKLLLLQEYKQPFNQLFNYSGGDNKYYSKYLKYKNKYLKLKNKY